MERNRVGVDLDGCLYPFVETLAHFIHKETGRPMSEMPYATSWEFYKHQWGYTTQEFLDFYTLGIKQGFIFNWGIPEFQGREVLGELMDLGYEIHIITARGTPASGERIALDQTMDWLREYKVPFTSVTVSSDKATIPTDFFIDDNVATFWQLRNIGTDAYIMDQPWNRAENMDKSWPDLDTPPDDKRIFRWSEYKDAILLNNK